MIDLINILIYLMKMSLSSNYLDAFLEVAKTRNFSKAAAALHITQSALSQRVMNLEEELETTLFVRDRSGVTLTDTGGRLLRYCQTRSLLEDEVLADMKSKERNSLAGMVRIAGYSSIVRSVLIPTLAPFLAQYPQVQCQFESYEMKDLPKVLQAAEADFVVMDYEWQREGVVTERLGTEEYVLIKSKHSNRRNDYYLDHDPSDTATFEFFRAQGGKIPKLRRSFMGDVYGVLDGVALGIGSAVMSRHLVTKDLPVKTVNGYKPRKVDVLLHYFEQAYYTKLHHAVRAALQNANQYLN